jgi:ABC-2 type transport system permease protein
VILSSVHPLELLIGKIIGYAAVAATQLALWVGVTALLMGVRGLPFAVRFLDALGWPLLALFAASYAVGYFLYASIYAAVGAVVTAEREAILLQQLLALALVSPFVIAATLVAHPTDPLAARLTWVPLLAPTLLVVRAAFAPVAIAEVAGALTLTALTALATLAIAARLFKGATLLSSRRLSWREAWAEGGRRKEE